MTVHVLVEGLITVPMAVRDVHRSAERMLGSLRMEDMELSVLLCDDNVIQALNRGYRGKDKPTDVLAFAMGEGEGLDASSGLLGDVVISTDTAARQAKAKGRPVRDEIIMLLAHGLLHLLGYDHQNTKEERLMHARTDVLCAAAQQAPVKKKAKKTKAAKGKAKAAPSTPKKKATAKKAPPRKAAVTNAKKKNTAKPKKKVAAKAKSPRKNAAAVRGKTAKKSRK